jgi:hypothetical protein
VAHVADAKGWFIDGLVKGRLTDDQPMLSKSALAIRCLNYVECGKQFHDNLLFQLRLSGETRCVFKDAYRLIHSSTVVQNP